MVWESSPARAELRHLAQQNFTDERVFVTEVDVDRLRLDRPRGDEDAFEEAVRVAVQVIAVLERAGFALVRVHRHQPGAFVAAHDAPLPTGGESCPSEAPQARGVELRGDVLERVLAREACAQQGITAVALVGVEGPVLGDDGVEIAGFDDGANRLLVHVVDVAVPDLGHRGGVAPAHARRPNHPNVLAEGGGQQFEQGTGARELAREAVADPHRDRRRRRLAPGEHVEVRVERRDLVDLGHRQAHLVGERGEMRRGDAVPGVLDQVQVLDEEVTVARAIPEQGADLVERGRIDLPPLRPAAGHSPTGAGMAATLWWFGVGRHS